jgi:enoyl-[acyl-carrier protein] reductase I
MNALRGKKGLIVGVANDRSIAYGCARRFRSEGADLALTYRNAKTERYVRPLSLRLAAKSRGNAMSPFPMSSKASSRRSPQSGDASISRFTLSASRAEDLRGHLIDCSADGFAYAMQVSVHSFLRMAKLSEPLMASGGCLGRSPATALKR